MASQEETLRRYLVDAVAAEEGFERQLRAFAEEGDDDEVRNLFLAHAEETADQRRKLTARLEQLRGKPSAAKSLAANLFSLAPKSAQVPQIPEELTVQNLTAAYTVEAAECAMYEALIAAAGAAGDAQTVELARGIQRVAHQAADRFWSCLPSRSLIAYNMLTVSEVDPAVQTKIGEATWT